mgnify:CR=1 FL=1
MPLTEAMRIRGKLENYDRVDQVLDDLVASTARRRSRAQGRGEADLQGPQGKGAARRGADAAASGSTAATFDEVRPIWIETRRAAAHARVRRRSRAAKRRRSSPARFGTADDAQKIESFEGETWKSFMLHYNFPPFSVGEVAFLRGARPPRSRPRRARRALARADDSRPRKTSLHRPRRVGHPRIERIVVDGVGVRRIAGDDGCRRSRWSSAGRGHRDGPRDGREDRQVRGAVGHRRRRGSLRRHGLQGRRHGRRHHRAADGHQGRRASRPR